MDIAAYKLLWILAVGFWATLVLVLAAIYVQARSRCLACPPDLAVPLRCRRCPRNRPMPAILTEWADRQAGDGPVDGVSDRPNPHPSPPPFLPCGPCPPLRALG